MFQRARLHTAAQDRWLPQGVLALILMFGLLGIWVFLFAWGVFFFADRAQNRPYRQLVITRDGQAVISTTSRLGDAEIEYRTLDGQPFEIDLASILKARQNDGADQDADSDDQVDDRVRPIQSEWKAEEVYLAAPASSPAHRLTRIALHWNTRIKCFGDTNPPGTNWYLIHDRQPSGHAYFIGYNNRSNYVVGYLGTEGFRDHIPPLEQQFPITASLFNSGAVASISQNQAVIPLASGVGSAKHGVFIAAGGKLYNVLLERRTVESIALPAPVESVAYFAQDHPERYFIAARLSDRIAILNLKGKLQREILLPEHLRSHVLGLALPDTPDAIVTAWDLRQSATRPIYWIDPQGTVVRQARAQLGDDQWNNPIAGMAWIACGFLLSLLLVCVFIPILVSDNLIVLGVANDYGSSLAAFIGEGWVPLLILAIISGGLALWTFRRQQQYSRRGAIAWAVFVFLMGPLGFLGYLLHRSWPKRVRCPHCQMLYPQTGACHVCANPNPIPSLLGIEIFA